MVSRTDTQMSDDDDDVTVFRVNRPTRVFGVYTGCPSHRHNRLTTPRAPDVSGWLGVATRTLSQKVLCPFPT
jgi:hypothetical protein